MKIAIHQPQYMPWIGYFHKMASCDLFVLLDDVQFKKNEWQHRNRIRNPEGAQWLSVPTSYRFPEKINEVRVNEAFSWREKHMKSIEAAYGKSLHFKDFENAFRDFFKQSRLTIDQVNGDSIFLLRDLIGIKTPVKMSSQLRCEGVSTQRLINICKLFEADTYLAGAGAHAYMDFSEFERANIRVEVQEFKCPSYPQRWAKSPEDFIPNLSALDLIFNCGRASFDVLMMKQ